VTDLLQSDAATGQSQESGVEDRYGLPPATLQSVLNELGVDDSWKVTYVERPFPLRLCKTSGLRSYQGGGAGKNVFGCANFVQEMENHYLWSHQTVRAEFCSEQCRNLWRDTKKRREQGVEL
jgi:hypothetical protein